MFSGLVGEDVLAPVVLSSISVVLGVKFVCHLATLHVLTLLVSSEIWTPLCLGFSVPSHLHHWP